ncbi:flagellar biosynthesis anti-sigma factor FlgM [bacterium]|nr:flagellar biosynthesis anti-sigma factor FlgM [bacterium]
MVRDINNLGAPPKVEQRINSNPKPAENASQGSEASKTPTTTGDQVNLSGNAQTLKSAEEKIRQLADVNEARVAEVKAKIDGGNYSVDNQAVADKMLEDDNLF